jgi:hypothetical protein
LPFDLGVEDRLSAGAMSSVATIGCNSADGWPLTYIGPEALARHHQTLGLKEAEGAPDGRPADAVLGLELALCGKFAAAGSLAAPDLGT